jgi:hypothetical protein
MLLAVLPSHDPMSCIPRGNGRKRSRGSFSRNHRPNLYPRERAEGRTASIIGSADPLHTTRRPLPPPPSPSPCQSQPRLVPHRRRKKRRFSANGTGVLSNHCLPQPTTSHSTKPVFPTPPPTTAATTTATTTPSSPFQTPSPPPSSPRTDADGRSSSVISERLRLKMSKALSTTAHGSCPTGQVCTLEDWQDIKELFAKAAEQYNGKHVPNICKKRATMRLFASPR